MQLFFELLEVLFYLLQVLHLHLERQSAFEILVNVLQTANQCFQISLLLFLQLVLRLVWRVLIVFGDPLDCFYQMTDLLVRCCCHAIYDKVDDLKTVCDLEVLLLVCLYNVHEVAKDGLDLVRGGCEGFLELG